MCTYLTAILNGEADDVAEVSHPTGSIDLIARFGTVVVACDEGGAAIVIECPTVECAREDFERELRYAAL